MRARVLIVAFSPVNTHGRLLRIVGTCIKAAMGVTVLGYEPGGALKRYAGPGGTVDFHALPEPVSGFAQRIRRVNRGLTGSLPHPLWKAEKLLDLHGRDAMAAWEELEPNPFSHVIAMHAMTLPVASRIAERCGARLCYDITEAASEQFDFSPAWRLFERPLVRRIEAHYLPRAHGITSSSEGFAEITRRNLARYEQPGRRATAPVHFIPNYSAESLPELDVEGPSPATPLTVLYQGLAGHDRYLHAIVRSLPSWPAHSRLVLQLSGQERGRERVAELLRSVPGVEGRVLVRPPVDADRLAASAYREGAEIGLCLLDGNYAQPRNALTNKLFSYVTAGAIPVTNVNTETGDFAAQHGLGPVLAETDPDSLAGVVAMLAERGPAYRSYRARLQVKRREFRWDRVENALLDVYAMPPIEPGAR